MTQEKHLEASAVIPPPLPPGQDESPTWEDDETVATALLRAAFVLVSGGLLAWAQWSAPIIPGQEWGRWVTTSLLFNLVLPVGLIWFFLAQGLTHQSWLKKQKNNAWNYGWNYSDWRAHLKLALWAWAIMLPLLWYFSGQALVKASYASYLPEVNGPGGWLFLLSTTVLYMFCWEFFFRGYLLFGLGQGVGCFLAILLQAGMFGLTHSGKPPVEMVSSFVGGLILGGVCWRHKSFLPAFYAHALIHLTWIVLLAR